MAAFRVLLVLCCFALVAYPVGRAIVVGLRTGRLPHSDSASVLVRSRQPFRFWALMILFAAMLGLCGHAAFIGLQRALA
jgi:hypothetical protein